MLYVFCVLVFGKACATIQIQNALAQPCFLHASAWYPALPHSYDLCLAVCPVAGEEHWCYMTRNPQPILDSSTAGFRQSKLSRRHMCESIFLWATKWITGAQYFCCFCTFICILCAFVISLCACSILLTFFIFRSSLLLCAVHFWFCTFVCTRKVLPCFRS